jgi:hypothetical protein
MAAAAQAHSNVRALAVAEEIKQRGVEKRGLVRVTTTLRPQTLANSRGGEPVTTL